MIQCITFPPRNDGQGGFSGEQEASTSQFTATYVETQGRRREARDVAGRRYKGSLGSAPRGVPLLKNLVSNMISFKTIQGQKDTANTAIAEHGDKILALMEQAPPSEIEVDKSGRVRTVEPMTRLNGAIPNSNPFTGGTFGAHGRTCPITGDRIHVSYSSSSAPFVRVDIFSEQDGKGWQLKQSIPVNTPTPIMAHDLAITTNYAVVLDFPLTVRPMRMLSDRFPVEYEPENGARIGLVPRNRANVSDEDIVWFECDPCVVLHTANAYETKGGKVVVHALRSEPTGEGSYITEYATAFLYEWILDLETGETIEHCLNADRLVEFPVIDDRFTGSEVDAVYCSHVSTIGGPLKVYKQPREGIKLDGIVKFSLRDDGDVKKGDVVGQFTLPDSWYAVSEPTVVPKTDGSGAYVLLIATQVRREEINDSLHSQVLVLDGDRLDYGPLYALNLPYNVPYGLHSAFIDWNKMK
jgi:carotenoid cleavage dioxygenase